ncbi:MAG: anaerobic ribonucleoside-triphosphate reductase activating protein [Erysipelotrichaceae bacterium]|nr:anaerobic ribonucleoside-triphosphate reductase activating protein [Erysipelotrichaceae bacterium]
MNYGELKKIDIANGNGCRVSLFVSGCTNHCPGCFQPQTWNFEYGKPFTKEVEAEILQALKPDYIEGFSLLGGEPFEFANQKELLPLLRKIKQEYPNKTIWCWTGFVLDQDLLDGGKRHGEDTDEMLSLIDVLVDGPFTESLKDLMLEFRGSSNQRLIDLQASLKAGEVIPFKPGFKN